MILNNIKLNNIVTPSIDINIIFTKPYLNISLITLHKIIFFQNDAIMQKNPFVHFKNYTTKIKMNYNILQSNLLKLI